MKNKASLHRNPVAKFMHKANNYACFHEGKRDKILLALAEKEGEEALLTYLDYCDDGECLDDVGCSSISIDREEG